VRALRAFDAKLASIEGHLAALVLLSMVLIASLQALLFNVAQRGIGWAGAGLAAMSWADTFLQKGTLALAFLGASLATHDDKHIAIDALVRVASGRVAASLRLFASLGSGVVACALALVFYRASVASDATVPFEYEILTAHGPAHVCDVAVAELAAASRPGALCALRSTLATLGVPISTGAGAAQLIAPLMLTIIGLRLLGRAVGLVSAVAGSAGADGEAQSEKR
jgi:TRAP-type C4-dicarboxylate transport system permease small subunit